MTAGHLFYIPLIAIAGLVLGFLWGRTAALREMEARQKLEAEREAKREARRERKAKKAAAADDA